MTVLLIMVVLRVRAHAVRLLVVPGNLNKPRVLVLLDQEAAALLTAGMEVVLAAVRYAIRDALDQ